jgi:hypothetical protein
VSYLGKIKNSLVYVKIVFLSVMCAYIQIGQERCKNKGFLRRFQKYLNNAVNRALKKSFHMFEN